MLEPESEGFRFLDLPAEIRTLVYSFMLEDTKPIEMTTIKRPNQMKRPVRSGRFYKTSGRKRWPEDESSGAITLVCLQSLHSTSRCTRLTLPLAQHQ